MLILNVRPTFGEKVLATFDLELGGNLRLYNMALRRTPDGRLRSVAPKALGKHAATFAPDLADQISRAAHAALEGGRAAHASQ
ncbi:hypothetical protein VQ045_15315 [Aurantimonas sp. E1-2-R+4]|uniref:hypothetical protein n=1 Tax=Aurantimonas sp. E1-2-R+4 TaxID=3113714 RepID=UPI002F91F847